MIEIIHNDCVKALDELEENSIDACVTDPPYGLGQVKDIAGLVTEWLSDRHGHEHVSKGGFMGCDWDKSVPSPVMWRSLYRVLKPGAYALVFSGTRTQDLMGLSLRFAGFEIVGSMCWVFGAGFPKGLDVSKALDKDAGVEREVVLTIRKTPSFKEGWNYGNSHQTYDKDITTPTTSEAKLWDGYRTQLKPAHEPILIVRKPLDGTTVQNVKQWGCGAFNIDGSRIGNSKRIPGSLSSTPNNVYGAGRGGYNQKMTDSGFNPNIGRYPSDLLLTHAYDCEPNGQCGESCPIKIMGEQSGVSVSSGNKVSDNRRYAGNKILNKNIPGTHTPLNSHSDTGTASRYFYQCYQDAPVPFLYEGKSSKRDRTCDGQVNNTHPTVKPRELIKYLVNLIMPPSQDAVVIDPFSGSGTTGIAAKELGRNAILIEREDEYIQLIKERIAATTEPKEPDSIQLSLID